MIQAFKNMAHIGGIMLAITCTTVAFAASTPTDKVVDKFMELDQDTSHGVSMAEYMAMVNQRALERFKQMDQNHDGEVTEEEYRHFWQAQKAKWYRLHR